MKISLQRALVALVGGAVLLALVPAGVALDRRLVAELERKAREDLAMAPKVLADRNTTRADALMMHAKDLAGTPELASALEEPDVARAAAIARTAAPEGEAAVLLDGTGRPVVGPSPPAELVEATRRGEMPVRFHRVEDRLFSLSLAPVTVDGAWIGAAGVAVPIDRTYAGTLAGLTRSEVALLDADGAVVASTAGSDLDPVLSDSVARWSAAEGVHTLALSDGTRYWAAVAPLDQAGWVAFLRDAERELSVLPALRRGGLLAALVALGAALLLGSLLAAGVARPVRALSDASRRLAQGEFGVEVPGSALLEVDRMSRAFRDMRDSLADKLRALTDANRELEERQDRLQSLQAELVQRDRLAATGRLVTELAHEIRNPVASVRNCLEILHRRLEGEPDLREYSDMAIEELLRMHRLAEQMLEMNRPMDPEADTCDPLEVARRVAAMASAASDDDAVEIGVAGPEGLEVDMGPDALKQVLLNLVENAREAMAPPRSGSSDAREPAASGSRPTRRIDIRLSGPEDVPDGDRGSRVTVDVLDEGPGIDPSIRSKIFDAFFTTKDAVHGVGLGLFVAEGLVRRHGGRLVAAAGDGGGARLRITLPGRRTGREPSGQGVRG